MAEKAEKLGQFKSQPWILFDKVAARSFLVGDDRAEGRAIGSQNPAITATGEMVFFQERTSAQNPTYTNLDQKATLSYGMEVWGAYLELKFPTLNPYQANRGEPLVQPGPIIIPAGDAGPPPIVKLAEALLNFGVVVFDLGQENQTRFPTTRFGAGGGLQLMSFIFAQVQNSIPQRANVMTFPEPIEMPRTQNFSVKIQLAPEVLPLIGTPAAPGVGIEQMPYLFSIWETPESVAPVVVPLTQPPYAVEIGLIGRRIKFTQYGQVPAGEQV